MEPRTAGRKSYVEMSDEELLAIIEEAGVSFVNVPPPRQRKPS
jgi:hypothetical protein